MRTRRPRNRLDLIDLQNPKVRQPAMKAKQRIVVGGTARGQSLPQDRTIELRQTSGPLRLEGATPKPRKVITSRRKPPWQNMKA
jgi:ribosome biogenesis SPOUT family RNA methylase Rps3